jgi:hypothetical protein
MASMLLSLLIFDSQDCKIPNNLVAKIDMASMLLSLLMFLSSIVRIGGKMAKIWMVLVKSTKLE